jgi:hypothetical protein
LEDRIKGLWKGDWADMDDEEGFARLEHKAEEIRKMLFGALLLAKELWKDQLSQGPKGVEIMEAMEAAEDAFADRSQADRGKRLEQTIDVIGKRAKSIFDVMSFVSRSR